MTILKPDGQPAVNEAENISKLIAHLLHTVNDLTVLLLITDECVNSVMRKVGMDIKKTRERAYTKAAKAFKSAHGVSDEKTEEVKN
jgi:hypothetical protein